MGIDRGTVLVCIFALIGVLVVLVIPGWLLSSRFWSAIRSRHPGALAELGEPRLFQTRAESRRMRAFVKQGRYLELHDPEIDSLGRKMIALSRIHAVLFWTTAALIVLSALTAPGR